MARAGSAPRASMWPWLRCVVASLSRCIERRHHGDAGRLLADIEVVVADELLLVRQAQHRLLEAPDQQHALEEAPGKLARQGRRAHLIARGLTGEPTAPVMGMAGATNRNS